jgi:hypothetical protein
MEQPRPSSALLRSGARKESTSQVTCVSSGVDGIPWERSEKGEVAQNAVCDCSTHAQIAALCLRLQRPTISDYVTLRAAAVTVGKPHGRGDRRPEGVHVDFYEAAGPLSRRPSSIAVTARRRS